MTETLRLMIVAGEASGDAHAASLVRALRASAPQVHFQFFGATGALMRAEGVEAVVRSDDLAIMGIVEVARVLPKFWRAFQALKRAAIERQPDAVILVDWPDFNMRLARALHRRGLKIIYYISPQLWAWRSYRVRSIRRDVDKLLAILPFEPDWYTARGVRHVEFVGHPLAGEVRARYDREEFCRRNELDQSKPLIALLPGSRHKEIERILPPMLDAAMVIASAQPEIQFVVAVAPNRPLAETEAIIAAHKNSPATHHSTAHRSTAHNSTWPGVLRISQHETREALAAADAAAVASGTATLEAALIGTPLVIVYKESPINWHTLGRLITAEHFGLVNLIADKRLVTELMQTGLNGQQLAAELLSLLAQPRNQTMREQLRAVTAQLGAGGASRRAADAVIKAVREWRQT